jgi:hypothetical protein
MNFFAESDVESEEELGLNGEQDILTKSSQSLGITRSYVADWPAGDAFREFFQNW